MILFLEILKWIGIVLLVILALAIIIILVVLFVPIRYRILSEGSGKDIKVNVKAGWMAPALSIRYDYNMLEKIEDPLVIRAFGIRIGRHKKED